MEVPPEKRWISHAIAPLRAHGYTGAAANRVWDAISRDEDEKGTAGARQRAERVVTALLHIVTNGLLPTTPEEEARREDRLRKMQSRERKLLKVHRFVIECTGNHKLPRVLRKRAGACVVTLEELARENQEGWG